MDYPIHDSKRSFDHPFSPIRPNAHCHLRSFPKAVASTCSTTSPATAHAVSCCRFPPRGVLGSADTVVRASAYGLEDGYLARCVEELLVMCQVESVDAVSEIEAIAAVEGVDVIQMGPLDLSGSMGYQWDPGNKKVRQVLRELERRVLGLKKRQSEAIAAAEGGIASLGEPYLGGFAMPHDPPEELKAKGYHMVAGAVDVGAVPPGGGGRRAAVPAGGVEDRRRGGTRTRSQGTSPTRASEPNNPEHVFLLLCGALRLTSPCKRVDL
ncbi:hypothetical protein ZIOFF_034602 [Zingiber officinale]|uniref:HpcH/HpaI aldolase/citrate lyase domain-containing protein n=1 Tax=Zingiber officinale TaxID=94328 RepID=A0A8J5LD07_ZINOF|nr:hypothetical protein ZIOFF_034602 [Zingiber officinale]